MPNVTFIHTGAAALGPVMQYYSNAAPDLAITNLLEDGLLRLLAHGKADVAEQRLRSLVDAGRDAYEAELAMVTCSTVPHAMVKSIAKKAGIPVLKIDAPMAKLAVETAWKVGVAVTYGPTFESTSALLVEAAAELNRPLEIQLDIIGGAYDALLKGDTNTHDRLLLDGIQELGKKGVEVIVLAQVSMARVRVKAQELVGVPVLSSLETSLRAVRAVLG